jgi:NADH-quinone oxidoreductase subunit L
VFHLFTHAFFKALLFLGAGSVSHSGSHHSFDMKNDMGWACASSCRSRSGRS